MAKPKSRITVTNRADGVTVRATGSYAMNLLAALMGKAPVEALRELQQAGDATAAAPDASEHGPKPT
ncbi:MAG: hypothetical protein ABI171_01080 [Collimonas sp.]|uniref:hypothetical protein n=1 Tax=Collimonas sp. TaxID=1963772 RepID=UPI0032635CA1